MGALGGADREAVTRESSVSLILACALLGLVVFLSYGNALMNDFVWDDRSLVPAITREHSPDPFAEFAIGRQKMGYFRPVVVFSFLVDDTLWPKRPWGYHLTNVFLHLAATLFLYLFLRELTAENALSLAGALLFAVHPVHTEAVTFVSGRTDVLCALFYFAALALFALLPRQGRRRGFAGVAAFTLAFFLALGSKEMAVTLPAVLPLLLWRRDRPWSRSQMAAYVSCLAALLAYLVGRGTVLSGSLDPAFVFKNLPHALLQIPYALWTYVRLIVVPWPLDPYRDLGQVVTPASRGFLLPLAGVGCVVALLCLRGRMTARLVLAGFVAFLPVLNIIPTRSATVADRFLYLPSAFLLPAVVIAAATLGVRRLSGAVLLAAASATLMTGTIVRNRAWHDEITLWEAKLQASSNRGGGFFKAHLNIGEGLTKAGKYQEALPHFQEAMNVEEVAESAGLRNNLGVALEGLGRLSEARKEYLAAVRLEPGYEDARVNLAVANAKEGRSREAEAQLRELLRINPGNVDAHNNLGVVLAGQGRVEEAVSHYREALRYEPDFAQARVNLDKALSKF